MRSQLVAICFDLDGVLIDTMPLHAKAWQQALKPLGLRVSRRAIYEREGESGAVTARTLLSRHEKNPSPQAVAALLKDKEQRFRRLARRIRVNPQLVRRLGQLSRRRVRLALVTGTSSGEVRRVVPRGVREAFDAIVTGDRVRRSKPHPEPYRRAFHQLRVAGRQVIVVENAPYGIRAARRARAGLIIALTSSLPKRCLRGAHLIVTSVRQLCEVLERLTSVV